MKWWMAVALAAAVSNTLAAPVKELKPAEVAAFLAAHDMVFLQVTSPDKACSFCKGADRVFDDAAAQPTRHKIAFARVTQPSAGATLDLGALGRVSGMPAHRLFRSGKPAGEADGPLPNGKLLLYTAEQLIAASNGEADMAVPGGENMAPQDRLKAPPARTASTRTAASPAAAPSSARATATTASTSTAKPSKLSDADLKTVRLHLHSKILKELIDHCGQLLPAKAAAYKSAYAQWEKPRSKEISRGFMLLLTKTSESEMERHIDEAANTIRTWQREQLGVTPARSATGNCDQLAGNLDKAP